MDMSKQRSEALKGIALGVEALRKGLTGIRARLSPG